jgi:hypothetical protein
MPAEFDDIAPVHEAFREAFAGLVTEVETVPESAPLFVVVRLRNDDLERDVQLTAEQVRDELPRIVRRELKTWSAALRMVDRGRA